MLYCNNEPTEELHIVEERELILKYCTLIHLVEDNTTLQNIFLKYLMSKKHRILLNTILDMESYEVIPIFLSVDPLLQTSKFILKKINQNKHNILKD